MNPELRLKLGLLLIALALVGFVYLAKQLIAAALLVTDFRIETAIVGQWGFGIYSWPLPESARLERETVIVIWHFQFVIERLRVRILDTELDKYRVDQPWLRDEDYPFGAP